MQTVDTEENWEKYVHTNHHRHKGRSADKENELVKNKLTHSSST